MISERTSLLIQATTRECGRRGLEEGAVKVSLSDRLSSLTTSADRWKNRVVKEADLGKCSPATRAVNKSVKRSMAPNIHIDQGLTMFFTPTETTPEEKESQDTVDLDAIAPTEKLNMIRKTPIARPQKRLARRPIEKEIEITDINFVKARNFPSLQGVKDDLLVFSVSEDLNEPVAKSARDGLSAVEDYSQTKKALRSPTNNDSPYPEVMLIQVGGDEFIDVRTVVAASESIHESACYLLITRSSIIIHNGSESKVLERSKAVQVASSIQHTKQLNCGASKVKRTCEHDDAKREFWRTLKSQSTMGSVMTGDDLVKKNRVYSVVGDEMEIKLEIVGEVPCHSLLHPSKCLIFNFHSELYIWSGRNCGRRQALAGEDYAKQMQSQLSSFLIVRKISQGMPDVLFSSKFVNWPTEALSTSRPQMMRTPMRNEKKYKWKESIQSDASSIACHLLKSEEKRDEIVLEDVALDGTNENVITERKSYWRLEGDDLTKIDETNEFRRDSCYVVKWQYRIETRVGRLNGRRETDEERETGRERIAFFYWLGRKSGVKEQGTCALRLSDMDNSKSPHIRMEEGSETALFLSLFNGLFTVRDSNVNEDSAILLVLWKSHGRSSFYQMDPFSPLRAHGTYIKKRDGKWIVVAGVDSNIKDVRAAFNVWDGISKDVECIVQGDDASIEWIECKNGSTTPRMYRILGSESDIVQPSRPGTTFPYSQSCLDSHIMVDCGKVGWLWSELPLSDTTLNVALMIGNERRYTVKVIEKGGEPSEFKALFPVWDDYEERKEGCARKLEEIIEERLSLTPAEAIKRRNERDELIDIENIEKNLSEESFEEMYGMSRSHFSFLPQWRQLLIRKERGFF